MQTLCAKQPQTNKPDFPNEAVWKNGNLAISRPRPQMARRRQPFGSKESEHQRV
jgi:hypothetical protein